MVHLHLPPISTRGLDDDSFKLRGYLVVSEDLC